MRDKFYPTPQVERENIEYAKMLAHDYAGATSEDTAIHLYSYQAIILEKTHPDIAEVLEKIAFTEMHHLELLGKTIYLLGLKPKYVSYTPDNIKQYWNSSSVNYTVSLTSMLKQNIKAESMAIATYERQRCEINDKYIKNLLTYIIEDEKQHLETFTELLKKQKKLE